MHAPFAYFYPSKQKAMNGFSKHSFNYYLFLKTVASGENK